MARPTNEERAARAAAVQEAQAEKGHPSTMPESGQFVDVPVLNENLNLEDDIARIQALREANPFGAFDQKMKLSPIEGYKLHWFNDKPGRIETAIRAGWTHIHDRAGKPLTLIVDSGGLRAYAMKIPEQFWAEDQARQQARADAALAAVKKKPTGTTGTGGPSKDQGAFYTPNPSGDAATISRS
jgi:hypothetical protein